MGFRLFCVALALWAVSVQDAVHAQFLPNLDLPAAPGADDARGGPEASDVDVDQEPAKPDEVVRQLESLARRGGLKRAEAVRSLTRIGAWPQVDRWVAALGATDNDEELAAAARVIGTDLLLRISLREELGDSAKAAIKRMFEASKSVNESPEKIRQAIALLAKEDPDSNLQANRLLLRGGNAATTELVNAIAVGLPNRQNAKAVAALGAMGNNGHEALGQVTLYGAGEARGRCLQALTSLNPEFALDSLITAVFATDSTPLERSVAQQVSAVPASFNREDAVTLLADHLGQYREIAFRAPNDVMPVTLWMVNAERNGIQPSRSTLIYKHYRDAYDAAQRLRRLGDLPESVARDVLATDLAYRLMVDVDWGDSDQIKSVLDAYPDQMQPDVLNSLLGKQIENRDVASTVGLVRLLRSMAESGKTTAAELLQPGPSSFPSLVQAAQAPEPRVRYEAAALILDLVKDGETPFAFPGSSYVKHTLSEMASLKDRPTVLLLETRPVVGLRQENNLGRLGYEVRPVSSALELERALDRGGDFRMVLSKIQIVDLPPAELVDRIRRMSRGSQIPIVFFSDPTVHEKNVQNVEWETFSRRWTDNDTASVYLVDLPGSPASFADVLTEIESKRRLPAMSISDRAEMRRIGTEALQGESTPR